MAKWMMAAVMLLGFGVSGCGGKKIVTITFPKKDGNSEYWVCDRDTTNCHGKKEGDVEPTWYKPGLDTLSPPVECDNGAAKIEIVVKGNKVEQIGYECAQPSAPTGLPPVANAEGGAEEDEGDDGSSSPAPVDAPTGLPPVVHAEEDEEQDGDDSEESADDGSEGAAPSDGGE